MRRTFQLSLPNGVFGDPLLVVRPRLQGHTILLDAGDTTALSARSLLAVTDVLLSHAHVDHTFGLGRLLRVRLGRLERPLRIFGPPRLVSQVRSFLGSFSWNLVDAFPLDLSVIEVHADHVETWRFPSRHGFEPFLVSRGAGPHLEPPLRDDFLAASALVLEHGDIPCLAWKLTEHVALNVDAVALAEAGLPTGPWLTGVKQAIRQGATAETPIALPDGRTLPLGELRTTIIRESEGDALAYVTDAAPGAATVERVSAFASGVRRLVIECHFLDEDGDLAREHGHLTAALAGEIARRAGCGSVSPVHFSTRYIDRETGLLDELARAAGSVPVEMIAPAPLPEEPAP